jgi:uncharacterized protein with HEPN domain
MKDEVLAHLHDIAHAGKAVKRFVAGRTFEHYAADEQLRSAVERKFEIMGEALNRIHRDEAEVLRRIREHRDIVSFRNILVHGYDAIDAPIVWGVIEDDLDALLEDVAALLSEEPDSATGPDPPSD